MVKQGGRQLNPERRQRILTAAEDLFLRNGLRATSMEAIARAAGVAKPTLYAYFRDKDVVFATLAERVLDSWRGMVIGELNGPGATPERIARALSAKQKAYFRLVHSSSHAADFYGESSPLLAERIAAFDRWLEETLIAVLDRDGHGEARKYAQILIACAAGLCAKAQYAEEIGPATRLVVEHLLA